MEHPAIVLFSSIRVVVMVVNRWAIALLLMIGLMVSACAIPQVSAEDRLYLNLSLEFLDEFEMPKQVFEETPVGGLSAIAYDRRSDRIYALSDDRGDGALPRFYTLQMILNQTDVTHPVIQEVAIAGVTPLLNEAGEPFSPGTIDPEGIALSPQHTLIISSEGVTRDGIPPFINEFDWTTGQQLRAFPIPERYVPSMAEDSLRGVQDNRGFEALTLSAAGMGVGRVEPFRVFAAIEEPLRQDIPGESDDPEQPQPGRLLHYVVGDDQATLIAEHLYPIDPKPFGAANNGLVDLVSIDQAGHFFSLERSFGLLGAGARLFQVAIANATDTSQINTFSPNSTTLQPIYKRLILDLSDLGIYLDNLEGMTLGPQLADGSQSLVLVSDDNFSENQITQWLLFKIVEN